MSFVKYGSALFPFFLLLLKVFSLLSFCSFPASGSFQNAFLALARATAVALPAIRAQP